jgi:hypothetical protein
VVSVQAHQAREVGVLVERLSNEFSTFFVVPFIDEVADDLVRRPLLL